MLSNVKFLIVLILLGSLCDCGIRKHYKNMYLNT